MVITAVSRHPASNANLLLPLQGSSENTYLWVKVSKKEEKYYFKKNGFNKSRLVLIPIVSICLLDMEALIRPSRREAST